MGQIDFKDEDDRGETKVLKAANGCLNAINRIIECIGSQQKITGKQEILSNIQQKVENMLFISLGPDFKDTHEYIVTCIAYLASYSDQITSNLWQLFPNIVELFLYTCEQSQAYYILDPLVVAISNFIQKGGEVFLSVKMQNDKTPLENLFQLISDIFNFSKIKTENLAGYGF